MYIYFCIIIAVIIIIGIILIIHYRHYHRQVTLRSAMWGVSKLDRQHPSVRAVLKALSKEMLLWDPAKLDRYIYVYMCTYI
jgi:hypothetical protein